jgi:hypothetical protein
MKIKSSGIYTRTARKFTDRNYKKKLQVRLMNSLDQASLLRTDARIIAEDDTHAVVALRINKKWVSRNLSFLAAIADLSAVLRQKTKA